MIPDGVDGIWKEFVRDLNGEGEILEDLRSEISSIRSIDAESISPVRVSRLMRIRFVLREFLRSWDFLSGGVQEELNYWAEYLGIEPGSTA